MILKWDRGGRLRAVPGEDLDSWQLVFPDGTMRGAGAAFSPLFRLLPGGRPLARMTDRIPSASERGYRWVADRRSTFGKLTTLRETLRADRVISESERRGR